MTTKKTAGTYPEEKEIRTAYLINGYIRHNLTEAEHVELDEWITASMINQQVFEVMTEGLMELKIEY
jgi:hypothetical protein